MAKHPLYHDPKTGRKIQLSEFTLIVLFLIAGSTIGWCAYCIGWGASFVALATPLSWMLRRNLRLPETTDDTE